jgi:translation elongation factor EF-1alpha
VAEQLVGEITHYYGRIAVAAVRLLDRLKVGDHIVILGRTSDFEQEVTSMEIEHQPILEALPGQEIGLKVIDRVRVGDRLYLVS